MLQVRRGLDLGEEALGAHHGRQLRLEYLEGDLTLVLQVAGEVDGRHPARAELALDPIAAAEGRVEPADGFGHRLHAWGGKGSPKITGGSSDPQAGARSVRGGGW